MIKTDLNQKNNSIGFYDLISGMLPGKEVSKIRSYIEREGSLLLKSAHRDNETLCAKPANTGLERSIFFVPFKEGKILLLFNRKKAKKDLALSQTPHKTVTLAVDAKTGQLYSSSSMSIDELDRERNGARQLKGISGCTGYGFSVEYTSKGKKKARAFRLFAKRGDLRKAIPSLSIEEKKAVCKKLVSSICAMHKRGLIHRDIKPQNILIYGEGKDAYPEIIDLSSVVHENNQLEKGVAVWSDRFVAPEYAKALAKKEPLENVTTSACDIWALGKVLSQLFKDEREPLLDFTIQRMLQVDPADRISSVDLEKALV